MSSPQGINLGPNSPTGWYNYITAQGKQVAYEYIRDPNLVIYNGAGAVIETGGWRPLVPSDLAANVSISGGVSVGNVAVTGGSIAISNTPNVIINSGSFGLTPGTITGSQAQIPVGARSYFIAVSSGNAWVNGSGPFIAPIGFGGGGYDGHWTLNSAINIGCTGGFVNYGYEA